MARDSGRWAARPERARGQRAPRQRRSSRNQEPGVPDVYREMLRDEAPPASHKPHTPKRRRVASASEQSGQNDGPRDRASGHLMAAGGDDPPLFYPLQTALESSDDSDEEGFDWEDVDIGPDVIEDAEIIPGESLTIVIGDQNDNSRARRKGQKPPTLAEKKLRLDVHKIHLTCLLYHVFLRNHWCNDSQLQDMLRESNPVPARVVRMLNSRDGSQTDRSKDLKEGLGYLCAVWSREFSTVKRGLSRSFWSSNGELDMMPRNTEAFSGLPDFRERAKKLEGSADYGAQLFCAWLRSLGVDTRLVCSIQPLPFTFAASLRERDESIDAMDFSEDFAEPAPIPVGPVRSEACQPIVRIGSRRRGGGLGRPPAAVTAPRVIPRPRHPIFWVEAFDPHLQRWIPVDCMATQTVARPTVFEPAINDPENSMAYVFAFEDSGFAKDVTRRYAKAFTAKTRKSRVERTDGGARWLKKALKMFKRIRPLDRDQVEDAALLQREMSEGLPKNIEDFKGHPVYVLQRHLLRNEAIYPLNEVGKVRQASRHGMAGKVEPVYRRRDVHIVKSADKWFRLGRQVKPGEVPLKQVRPRRNRKKSQSPDDDRDEKKADLYAAYQTKLYVPPPVENGKIPRNMYGNVDIYTRNMIPPGAVHVRSQQGREAARILGIDFADAITGFDFKGRQGTAVRHGVVVAAQFKDAMIAVLEGLHSAQQQELEDWRLQRAIALWRRFVVGMKIIARVNQYKDEAEDGGEDETTRDSDSAAGDDIMEGIKTGHELVTRGFHYEIIEPPDLGAQTRMVRAATNLPSFRALGELDQDTPMDDDLESLFGSPGASEVEVHDGGAAESQPISAMGDLGLSNEVHEAMQAEHRIAAKDDGEAGSSSRDGDTTSMLSHDPEDDDADPDWLD